MIRGITIKENKRINKPTIIEVESELYNSETIYQDVTLDTQCAIERKKQLTNIFKP